MVIKTTQEITKYPSETELIKALLNLNIEYNALIDNGCFLKSKTVSEYVNELLNGRELVVYFNDSHEPIIRDKDEKKYSQKLLQSKNYLVFFDVNHCHDTDIKLPENCKGLVTINSFNNLVDVLQSIFRLRKLGDKQSVDYYYTNIDNELTNDTLFKYLQDKLVEDLKKNRKTFLIQNIKSLNKFGDTGYNNTELTSYIHPNSQTTLMEIKNKNLELQEIFANICSPNLQTAECIELNKMIMHNQYTVNLGTSTNTSTSTNTNIVAVTNINTSVQQHVPSITQLKYKDILNTSLFNSLQPYINTYDYKGRRITIYEYYIILVLIQSERIKYQLDSV